MKTDDYGYWIETLQDLGFNEKDKQMMAKAVKDGVKIYVIVINQDFLI